MTEPLTPARERLQNMVRTDPSNMTVHSAPEVHDTLDAYRTEAIAKAIGQLRAVPVQCTALRGPVWYGQGWADAITTLEEIAEYSVPDYEAYPGELVRLRALALQLRAHTRQGNWNRVMEALHDHSVFERTARAAATEKASTTVPTAAPDFFQPGHTYQRRRWHFQCLAVAPNPFNEEVLALGYLYRPGEPATATALDPDDWLHGEWADVTEDGA